jgi:hypothetical protein
MDNEYITHQGVVYINDGWDIDEYTNQSHSLMPINPIVPTKTIESKTPEARTTAIDIIRKIQKTK